MAGQFGIEQIKKILFAAVESVNVASKVLHKEGIFVVFQLSDELMALSTVDLEALKKEISELDKADRDTIRDALKAKLVLVNPGIEQKIEGGVDLVEEGVQIVEQVIGLVSKVKQLVSA